ncbi:BnaA04g29410D [Brassica napus]|uniref:BnaA04g29410D protein n=1 Tax=Brassica napus TaxID=3708 RepID=A0A078IU03_BRANA|nr:BnaA04g29410D [Brassica napus]
MAQHVKDVVEEMNELKNLVLGYDGGYPPTSIPALKVILTLIEFVVKETKDLLRFGKFEVEKHPLPMVPNFSWEPQPAMMIPYIIEMIDVFVLDFDMMKIRVLCSFDIIWIVSDRGRFTETPNHLASIEKLKKIQEFLCELEDEGLRRTFCLCDSKKGVEEGGVYPDVEA